MRQLDVRRTSLRCAFRLTVAIALVVPTRARAQWYGGVEQADSLLASGRVAKAESLYYASSSARPRDAVARAALGRYLASRGALRPGAVLLEEARFFGGDSVSIARVLAPIYSSLGDYRALSVLPASPLSPIERERARWLVSHAPVLEFPDSVDTLHYKPVIDGSGIGIVSIGVGERRIDALIDPRVSGLVLRGRQTKQRAGLQWFGEDSSGVVAVVAELHLGDVILSNVPARLEETGEGRKTSTTALVGLDVLRRLAPTFDPVAQTLTLRRSGQVALTTIGTRSPMLLDAQGLRILMDGRWESSASRTSGMLLSLHRWTLDAKRGDIILQ